MQKGTIVHEELCVKIRSVVVRFSSIGIFFRRSRRFSNPRIVVPEARTDYAAILPSPSKPQPHHIQDSGQKSSIYPNLIAH